MIDWLIDDCFVLFCFVLILRCYCCPSSSFFFVLLQQEEIAAAIVVVVGNNNNKISEQSQKNTQQQQQESKNKNQEEETNCCSSSSSSKYHTRSYIWKLSTCEYLHSTTTLRIFATLLREYLLLFFQHVCFVLFCFVCFSFLSFLLFSCMYVCVCVCVCVCYNLHFFFSSYSMQRNATQRNARQPTHDIHNTIQYNTIQIFRTKA